MKTPKQIRKFLRHQPFFRDFKKFVMMEKDRSFQDKLNTLAGHDMHYTFLAFTWGDTVQGFAFWKAVHDAFTQWYFN